MLNALLATYSNNNAQHNSSAKNNYYKFNATRAYVQHTVALMQLDVAYAQQAQNNTRCTCTAHICKCATAFNMRNAINSAITVAQRKQAYAQRHCNFNLQNALAVLQAYNNAA